jgi:hypothetical protein
MGWPERVNDREQQHKEGATNCEASGFQTIVTVLSFRLFTSYPSSLELLVLATHTPDLLIRHRRDVPCDIFVLLSMKQTEERTNVIVLYVSDPLFRD